MACCSAQRAKAKKVAIRKATLKAMKNVKAGKVPPKKVAAKKATPKKVKPCTLCGKTK